MADRFMPDAAVAQLLPAEDAKSFGYVLPNRGTADLFGPRQRAPRRIMMQATDTGIFPDGRDCGFFRCVCCSRSTGWIYASRQEQRRGLPCPACNDGVA